MVPKCSLFERNETSFKVKNQNLQNIQIWVKTAAAILWRILEEFSLYWWKLESLEIKLISLKLITDHGFQNAQIKDRKYQIHKIKDQKYQIHKIKDQKYQIHKIKDHIKNSKTHTNIVFLNQNK